MCLSVLSHWSCSHRRHSFFCRECLYSVSLEWFPHLQLQPVNAVRPTVDDSLLTLPVFNQSSLSLNVNVMCVSLTGMAWGWSSWRCDETGSTNFTRGTWHPEVVSLPWPWSEKKKQQTKKKIKNGVLIMTADVIVAGPLDSDCNCEYPSLLFLLLLPLVPASVRRKKKLVTFGLLLLLLFSN